MNQQNSTFEKVGEFHSAFGHPVNTVVTELPPETIAFRLRLILEEFEELVDACARPDSLLQNCLKGSVGAMNAMLDVAGEDDFDVDYVEVADALGDLKYVTDGAAHTFGINLDKVFDEVHSSNMSKACSNLGIAEKTQAFYASKNVDTFIEPWVNTSGFIVKRTSDGKMLKSVDWREPDIESALNFLDRTEVAPED